MIQISINLTKLQAIAMLAPASDIRPYLNGVYVEATASETRLAATDGIHAGMLRHANDAPNEIEGVTSLILPLDIVARMKPTKYQAATAEILIESFGIGGGEDDTTYTVRLIDGSVIPFTPVPGVFPNLRRIVPSGPSTKAATPLDYERLHLFVKVHKALGASKHIMGKIAVGWFGDAKPVTIGFPCLRPSTKDFVGILMPMKDETGEYSRFVSEPWPTLPAPNEVPQAEHEDAAS